MRILAIDDEDEVLTYLKEMLEGEGHTVVGAHNVKEGLEFIDRTFDAIITDLSMHKLDGKDYIEIIKVRYPKMPIIVLSGHIVAKEALIELGVSRVLAKPINIPQLLEALNEVCRPQGGTNG